MKKGIIFDKQGNIKQTWKWATDDNCPFPKCLNIPPDDTDIDVTAMSEDEWREINKKLGEHKVELDEKGKHKKDSRGLPKIVKKKN